MVWRWDNADPFGVGQPDTNPAGLATTFTYNPRFPGQLYDNETGLHYNYHRTYSPSIGGYTQPDPIGLNGGQLSLYAYVGGNPVNTIDPLGLFGLGPCTNCHQGGGGSLNDLLDSMTPSDPLFPPGGQASSSGSSSSSSSSSAEGEQNCPDDECDPPKGTICFIIDRVPPSKPHYPIPGSHYHLWQMNQAPNGKCFWNKLDPDASRTAPPGAIPCPFTRPKR